MLDLNKGRFAGRHTQIDRQQAGPQPASFGKIERFAKKSLRSMLLLASVLTPAAGALAGTDPCLPFDMPSADTVLNSPKKVFAHYFYPLPLSIDDLVSTKDYYAVNYLNPHGENNKFVTQGGLLRARPQPVTPQSASNWQILNMEHEIRLAVARGVNGFAFDIMSTADAAAGGKLQLMLQAAQAVDSRFKIVLMPDMTGLGANTGAVASIVKAVYSNPALYHLPDGRLMLAPFSSESVSPSAWSSMLSQLRSQGYNIAFVPTFGSLQPAYVSSYAGISAGLGNFGNPGTPDQLSWTLGNAARVRASSAPMFFDGLTPQTYKPQSFKYNEAYNSLAYRNGWLGAIQSKADMVQVVTWNDFGESTHIEPAMSATGDSGTGFYNLTGYYATWWRTGVQPAITHDVLYYFYRKESYRASAPMQSQPTTLNFAQTPQDQIEVLAFLTAPATVVISAGGVTTAKTFGAGMNSLLAPLAAGTPRISVVRNGVGLFGVQGNPPIYPTSTGLPSGTLDLTYWSGSASSAGTCKIAMP